MKINCIIIKLTAHLQFDTVYGIKSQIISQWSSGSTEKLEMQRVLKEFLAFYRI
jgi:hypothetical protein